MTRSFRQFASLALQCTRGGGGFHHQLGVLLHHLIKAGYRMVNFLYAFHLFTGRDGNFPHNAGDTADAAGDLLHALTRKTNVAGAAGYTV